MDHLQKELDEARFKLDEYDNLPRYKVKAVSIGEDTQDGCMGLLIEVSDKVVPFHANLRVILVIGE